MAKVAHWIEDNTLHG